MMDNKIELTEKQKAMIEKFKASMAKATERKAQSYDPEKVKAFMEKLRAKAKA